MNAADVIAVVVGNGDFVCAECATHDVGYQSETDWPVFASEQFDFMPECISCGALLQVSLTFDGMQGLKKMLVSQQLVETERLPEYREAAKAHGYYETVCGDCGKELWDFQCVGDRCEECNYKHNSRLFHMLTQRQGDGLRWETN